MFERGIIVDGVKLDRRQTAAVHRQVCSSARVANRAKMWAVAGLAAVVLLPLGSLFGVLAFAWLLPRAGGNVVAVCIVGAAFGTGTGLSLAGLFSFAFKRLYRREIREALAQFGYALCPDCGYWLKGLAEDSDRCPECACTIGPQAPAE